MVDIRCYRCGRLLHTITKNGTIINWAKEDGMKYVGRDEEGHWYCQECTDIINRQIIQKRKRFQKIIASMEVD